MSELIESQQRQMDLYELKEQVKASLVMARAAGMVQEDSLAWFVVTGMSGWLERHDREVRAEVAEQLESEKRSFQAQAWEHGFTIGWEHARDDGSNNYGNDWWGDPTPNPYRSHGNSVVTQP